MVENREVIAVNFWKFSNFQLKRILMEYWNILLLIHNTLELIQIIEFLNKIPYQGKIAYISLTKTNESIQQQLKNYKLKISVIDCVSSQIFDKKDTKDCYFEPAPSNLKEMVELIEKTTKKVEPDFIVLDSLSQFIDFSSLSASKSRELYDFLDELKNRYSKTHYRFIILYNNVLSKELVQMPQASVDVILKYEVITGRVNWNE